MTERRAAAKQLRAEIERIFEHGEASVKSELLACVDAYERESDLMKRLDALRAENERLKQSARQRRTAAVKPDEVMSSRLKEALRE